MMLRRCLDLRKAYVYTEKAPWSKEAIPQTNASDSKKDPFHFEPVQASTVSCFLLINSV